MKKEINNTISNTTEIKTQEEKTMKNFGLKKFEDEQRYNRPELLTALYETREKFINAFDELYVTGKIEESVEYKKGVKTFLQISQYQRISGRLDRIVRKPIELDFQESADIMMSYMTEFINSAYVWEDLLRETIKKEILSADDINYIAGKILRTIRYAIEDKTFDSYGVYKIEKMPYREYKDMHPENEQRCLPWFVRDENTTDLNPLVYGPKSWAKRAYIKTGEYDAKTKTIEVYMAASEEQRKIGNFSASIGQENPNSCSAICKDSVIAAVRAYYHPQNRELFGCQLIKWLDESGFAAEREVAEFVLGHGEDFTKNEQMLVKFYSMQSEEFFDDRFSVEHMLQQMAEDLRQLKSEAAAKDAEIESKRQDIVERVENTFDIVGAGRTISNYTGIGDSEAESDYIEYIVRNLFGEDEHTEQRNKEFLMRYYSKLYKKDIENFGDDDFVIRMAEDLVRASYERETQFDHLQSLIYPAYDPETGSSETDYYWTRKLALARTKIEISGIVHDIHVMRRTGKIDMGELNQWMLELRGFSYEDWLRYITQVKSTGLQMLGGKRQTA